MSKTETIMNKVRFYSGLTLGIVLGAWAMWTYQAQGQLTLVKSAEAKTTVQQALDQELPIQKAPACLAKGKC